MPDLKMLTVDQVRAELDKAPENDRKERRAYKKRAPKTTFLNGVEKPCHNHPDRPARRAKSGRSLGLCQECIVAARNVAAATRMAKAGKGVKRGPRLPHGQPIDDKPIPLSKPLPKDPTVLKIYCMRCGFPMAIEDPDRFVERS
jgi:hypothetical protein